MFSANRLRTFLWLVSVWAVLVVGIGGCGSDEEDEPWVGTWSLQTVDGADWQSIFILFGATVEDEWRFRADGTWDMEMTLTAPDESEKETTRFSGTYILTDDTFSMSSPDPDFSLDFGISVEFEDDSLDSEQSSESNEETGTWVRDGDTLTLTTSDGQVLVFKKL